MFSLPSMLAVVASITSIASAASLVSVPNYGTNPGSVEKSIYVPDKVSTSPAIIVAVSPFPSNFKRNQVPNWVKDARLHGFGISILYTNQTPSPSRQTRFHLIYPSATRDSKCFDGNTNASLTHNGGSDSLSIVNMVKYTITKYNADPKKVFATGSSSGGIMSNVLAGSYPDVFSAVAPFSGMPYGYLLGTGGSSPFSGTTDCAKGKTQKTA